jgi:hypothetical protein
MRKVIPSLGEVERPWGLFIPDGGRGKSAMHKNLEVMLPSRNPNNDINEITTTFAYCPGVECRFSFPKN